MRVLVTWGSKRGGTEGIGRILAEALEANGLDVTATSADAVKTASGFDAVIVGGAVYANRWPANVRRFVRRNVKELRAVPVWFFSSGPLDDSADRADIPAPTGIAVLAERVGARSHVTFGGYLAADAAGAAASAMAKDHAGDWRNRDRIRAWADELARSLPTATPGKAIEHTARSIPRLLAHGILGWALSGAILLGLLQIASTTVALVLHAIATPLVFVGIGWSYFRARGARDPLPTALAFTLIVALLHLGVTAGAVDHRVDMLTSFAASWLPFALVFLATWATGALMSTMPWAPPERGPESPTAPMAGHDSATHSPIPRSS